MICGAGPQQRVGQLGAGVRPGARSCRARAAARWSRTILTSASRTRRPGLLPDAERGRHRLRHEPRVGQRRQLDEPDAVGIVVEHVGRDLQRQPRLADAARRRSASAAASCRAAVSTSASSRSRPTNDVDLLRQVVRRRLERAQRREVLRAAADARPGRRARGARGRAAAPRPGRAARPPAGRRSAHEVDDRLRQQHLAAVRGAHDARGAVDRRCRSSRCRDARRRPRAGRSARAARARRWPRIGERELEVERRATASSASSKAALTPSPVVFTTTPRWRSTAARGSASCRASAAAIRAGSRSHSRVLPSMSVKSRVTFAARGAAFTTILATGRARRPHRRAPAAAGQTIH